MGNKASLNRTKASSNKQQIVADDVNMPTVSNAFNLPSSTTTRSYGRWSWDDNGTWKDFEYVTSKQIDDSILSQWHNTTNNPIICPLTTGTWFSQYKNRNVYSVHVQLNHARTKINKIYQLNNNTNFQRKLRRTPPLLLDPNSNNNANNLNNDIYDTLLVMGFEKSISYQAAINCSNLNNAIEYVTNSALHQTNKQNDDKLNIDDPFNISRFQFVDILSELLVFGYIRYIQNEILPKNITFYTIPVHINQICAIFYSNLKPIEIKINKKVDGRDRWGKWFIATIKHHKKPNEKLPEKPRLHKNQKADIERLEKLEAVFVRYDEWEQKWAEWIFIEEDTICSCHGPCETEKTLHRLSAPNTQSKPIEEWKKSANKPKTPGCVGLTNVGHSSFMNSIVQCMSNTPRLRSYFTSNQYESDINTNNSYLGMRGKFVREFGKLLIEIWSNEHKVIKPDSFRQSVSTYAPQFNGAKFHDALKFLHFLLDSLNDELNEITIKPYKMRIVANGRSDEIVAEESWENHLERNKSKIVDLFHGLCKSHILCQECNANSISFDPYMYLSLPVIGGNEKTFIVDVFHRNQPSDPMEPTKPYRHVFHVNTSQKIEDLAKMVADHYHIKPQFALFYENWNMKISREYQHGLRLAMVPNREALACYILKDWNEEVTAKDIKTKKITLELAKLCHSQPLSTLSLTNDSLFGMPFVVSFLNVDTRKELHKAIYNRLYRWIGGNILTKPPHDALDKEYIQEMLASMGFTINYIQRAFKVYEKNYGTSYNVEVITEIIVRLQCKDKVKEKKQEQLSSQQLAVEIDKSKKEVATLSEPYEDEWNSILTNLPYTLRIISSKSFNSIAIPCDNVVFMTTNTNQQHHIVIEWKQEFYDKLKAVVNKVVVTPEYSKWKKEKAASKAVTIYDCLNEYISKQTIEKEEDLFYCSKCAKHQKATKKYDLWSFPEILIIHLKRFQCLDTNQQDLTDKSNTFIECPIRGLDLSKFVINNNIDTSPIYDLYATSEHNGLPGNRYDHYTAFAKNNETDSWHRFSDSSVQIVQESDVISRRTYILFYKKRH